MRYSSRFFLYAPFLVLIVIAIAAMLRWWTVADAFESWLLHANGREIAPGIRLRFASEEMGGFPFRVDTVLSGRRARGEVRARIGFLARRRFAIHGLTYGRVQEIFEAGGVQTLSWTMPGGAAGRLVFTPGSLRASAILAEGALARFRSRCSRFQLTGDFRRARAAPSSARAFTRHDRHRDQCRSASSRAGIAGRVRPRKSRT